MIHTLSAVMCVPTMEEPRTEIWSKLVYQLCSIYIPKLYHLTDQYTKGIQILYRTEKCKIFSICLVCRKCTKFAWEKEQCTKYMEHRRRHSDLFSFFLWHKDAWFAVGACVLMTKYVHRMLYFSKQTACPFSSLF